MNWTDAYPCSVPLPYTDYNPYGKIGRVGMGYGGDTILWLEYVEGISYYGVRFIL